MSLASGQPTLETVVVKAKRAASSLWILLHAQVNTLERIYRLALFCSMLGGLYI